jgi:DNA-binding MarR family transcriptional regulator
MDGGNADRVNQFLRGILALNRRVRAARPAGSVSLSELGILGSLHRLGPLAGTRLANEERLQPQSLTRLLAELQRSGLITRRRNENDRREMTVAITARGRKVLQQDLGARRAWLEKAMTESLTREERTVLLRASALMSRLANHEGRST